MEDYEDLVGELISVWDASVSERSSEEGESVED